MLRFLVKISGFLVKMLRFLVKMLRFLVKMLRFLVKMLSFLAKMLRFLMLSFYVFVSIRPVDVDEVANEVQKAKDEEENHELMLNLQSYFDFVLHHRDGEFSVFELGNERFDQQNKSLTQMLRSSVLNAAIKVKLLSDKERYEFLEWIPEEAMRGFADHLQWLVIPEKHCITIRQSGPLASVLFLVTGSLWNPFSKYVYTRHAKDGERVNKSEIITFNLQCLNPVHLRSGYDSKHAKERWEKLRADVAGEYVRCDEKIKAAVDGDVVYRRELTEKEVCFGNVAEMLRFY